MSKPTTRLHASGPLVAFACGHKAQENFTIIVSGQTIAPPPQNKLTKCGQCYLDHVRGEKSAPPKNKPPNTPTTPGVPPDGESIGPDAPTPLIPFRTLPKS